MHKVLLFVLLIVSSVNYAQKEGEYNQKTWIGYSLDLNLPKKFKLSFTAEQRFNDGFNKVDKNFLQSVLKYKSNKFLYYGFLYRIAWELEEERRLNRYAVFTSLNLKKDRFKFSNRNLIQANIRAYTRENSIRYRNKSKLKFRLTKKFKPYLSYELFYRFDEINKISNHRAVIGSGYSINKNWSIKVFYLLEKELKSDHNEIEGVIGFKLIGGMKI